MSTPLSDRLVLLIIEAASVRDLQELAFVGLSLQVRTGTTIAGEVKVTTVEPTTPEALCFTMALDGDPRDLQALLRAGLVLVPKRRIDLQDGEAEVKCVVPRAIFPNGDPPEFPVTFRWLS